MSAYSYTSRGQSAQRLKQVPALTHLVNDELRLLQHTHIAEFVGVEIVLTANHNEAVARVPSFRHLNAPSRILAEAVDVSEAGFFDEAAQGGFAICEVGGSEEVVGAGGETYGLVLVGLDWSTGLRWGVEIEGWCFLRVSRHF